MFFWKNRNKKHFTVRFPEESREVCTNPGRGWYHIYTFTLDKREKDGLLYQPYWDDETLVLVRFDIGANFKMFSQPGKRNHSARFV